MITEHPKHSMQFSHPNTKGLAALVRILAEVAAESYLLSMEKPHQLTSLAKEENNE
jgi:hypothetical protein